MGTSVAAKARAWTTLSERKFPDGMGACAQDGRDDLHPVKFGACVRFEDGSMAVADSPQQPQELVPLSHSSHQPLSDKQVSGAWRKARDKGRKMQAWLKLGSQLADHCRLNRESECQMRKLKRPADYLTIEGSEPLHEDRSPLQRYIGGAL